MRKVVVKHLSANQSHGDTSCCCCKVGGKKGAAGLYMPCIPENIALEFEKVQKKTNF